MNHRLLLALTAIGLCGAVAGCGGSSSTEESSASSTQGSAPSLAQYIERADQICKEDDQRSGSRKEELASEMMMASSKAEVLEAAHGMRTLADMVDADVAGLRAPGLPAERRQSIEEMLSLREEVSDLLRSLSTAAVLDYQKEQNEILDEMTRSKHRYHEMARALGFQVCG